MNKPSTTNFLNFTDLDDNEASELVVHEENGLVCNVCKESKFFTEYKKRKDTSLGYNRICIECTNLYRSDPLLYKTKKNILKFRDKFLEVKECNKCLKIKKQKEFNKSKEGIYGLASWCRDCSLKSIREWREGKEEHEIEYRKRYNKENKEKRSKYWKKYYRKNKERLNEKNNEYVLKRLEEDVDYRIRHNLRTRINQAIKTNAKSGSSIELLGCAVDEFKEHIESQWEEGMTWDNWTTHGWHIDHIRPCSSFDLTDPEQQKECFHYRNTQPMWAEENWSKNDTYDE